MKTFSDLKPGDKIFEIFDNKKSSVGVYELTKIVTIHDIVQFYIDTIIGPKRYFITLSTEMYQKCNFFSCVYTSIIFADEQEFLEALKDDKSLFDFVQSKGETR